MAVQNPIPTLGAAGRFEALAPFDVVVDPAKYYTVEALRYIHEMEGLKLNLYELLFKPLGVAEADFPTLLARAKTEGSVVVSLLDRLGTPTYVLTTYIKSFPMVDGVSYERMCAVVDFGPVPPSMKEVVAEGVEHMAAYVLARFGVEVTVKLGTIPTVGYVSKQQAEAYENTRKSKITDTTSSVAKLRDLEQRQVKKDAYIVQLEAKVIELSGP